MDTNKIKLLVALPCLNEEKCLGKVLERLHATLKSSFSYTLLVVDDGSTDQTAAKAKKHLAEVVQHGYNRGVGAAFQSAISYFLSHSFDLMVNIDADGQFAPEDIPKLLAPILNNEADFVTASRFKDPSLYPKMPKVKFWGNQQMSRLLSQLTRQKFYDVSCGFRAYSKEAIYNLNLVGKFTYTQETFLNFAFKGIRICEIPVKVQYFDDRKSRVANNLFRYAQQTLLIIFKSYRDYKPLSFFWGIAGILALFSLFFGGILMVHYFRSGHFSGHIWAGAVSGTLLILSILFFVSGIVTDMLDRVRLNQEKILYYLKKNS